MDSDRTLKDRFEALVEKRRRVTLPATRADLDNEITEVLDQYLALKDAAA